jgi:hypothetical protein
MKIFCFMLCFLSFFPSGCNHPTGKLRSGNPLFEGWYADPEAAVYDNKYWIFPTYSAPFEKQVFFDAFSSTDLVHWEKHSRILDSSAENGSGKHSGPRRPSKKTVNTISFLRPMMFRVG